MQESSSPRVLFVDDEPDLLAAMSRTMRSEHYEIVTAMSGAAALRLMQERGPFAVIVSDLKMPQMDGVTLLKRAREIAPETVRVLFTGQPDMNRAIAAVNEGEIFRFMTKPCLRMVMTLTLKGAVEQYRLVTSEKVLLEQTLHGSIKALIEALGLASPLAMGRAARLRQSVSALASALQVSERWHIEVAAMLSQIGCVTLPPAMLERVYRGEKLTEAEQTMIGRLPEVVEQILGNIPRLEPVREILRFLDKHFDGTGRPAGPESGEELPWGSRALRAILDLDALETEGASASLAFDMLRAREGWYDPAIIDALAQVRRNEQSAEVRELPAGSLRPGMVLAQDVKTPAGILFIARGQEVTASLLEKLRNFSSALSGKELIRVVVRTPPPNERQR
jgi:response regulator RpfG family c-di-GMP phosphodiesterase